MERNKKEEDKRGVRGIGSVYSTYLDENVLRYVPCTMNMHNGNCSLTLG